MLDRMVVGDVADKPHTELRAAGGELRYEECFTRAGFDGPFTIVYRTGRPQTLRHRGLYAAGFELPKAPGLLPPKKRHVRSTALVGLGGGALAARVPLFANDDVVLGVAKPDASDGVYWANGDADELVFVHRGGGIVRTPLGDLSFEQGDYVCVPRGLLRRFILDEERAQHWFVVECLGALEIPKQFRNTVGQLRMDAPYSHRDFRRPVFSGPRDEGIAGVVVKKNHAFHEYVAEHSPLDVVGWDGTVYPWAFPILRFQPRVGAVHLPPTVHGTFATAGALICSFVPRMLDFHPKAIPCPYPHSSVDVDEVIFYADGNFTSRKGVEAGSLTLHPAGVPHGPHAGAYEASLGKTRTEEVAVMLDCTRPLAMTEQALPIEDVDYEATFIE